MDNTQQQFFMHHRYGRQHVLRELGIGGQEKLGRARVLIVGAGGLGSPAAMYLAAAGIGTLGLVDTDTVDESNLHRQLLYGMRDIGARKLDAAATRLADVNPLVQLQLHHTKISASNARELIRDYDIVLDGTDNFPARYAINDACVALGVPFVYGSVARFEGQVSVFAAPGGPCYRCLFPDMPAEGTVPNCAEDGVIGILPGIIGLHQSVEVIKCITGLGRSLVGRLLMLDLLDHSTQEVSVARDASCIACGGALPVATVAPPTAQAMPESAPEIEVGVVAARLAAGDDIILLDVRETWEFELAHLPDAVLVPLSTIPAAVHTLNRDQEYVVYCHHGMRSAMAADWLVAQGFRKVSNMTGGIDAWSVVVDRAVPQY